METILRTLVKFPTVSGDAAALRALLDYVAGFVASRGMHVAWHESGGFESIVATTRPGAKSPAVLLAAHADVVAGGPSLFEMSASGGRYSGRGVYDMKFALAAYLLAIDRLVGRLADYDFGLMVTGDEEVGGAHGVGALVDAGYLPGVCLLPDGGDGWQIQTSSKGMILYEITASGRSAHGSRPWLGDNPLDKLLGVYGRIRALFPEHLHPDTNTVSLTALEGAGSFSQIPPRAHMRLDVRAIGSHEYARLHEAIQRLCRQSGVDCRVLSDGAPTSCHLDDPLVAPFARLVAEVTGVRQRGFRALGASDIRYFVPYGVPCISVYPTGGGIHADDEWIDAQACQDFLTIVSRYLAIGARPGAAPDPAIGAVSEAASPAFGKTYVKKPRSAPA